MTRDDLFEEVVRTSDGAKHILLQLATGLGKSRIANGIIDRNKAESFLVLVPELPLIQNYKDDMEKWGYADYILKGKFNAYDSIHLHEGKHYDIIVLDEAHHLSERRRESLSKISAKKIVYLSAKIEDEAILEYIQDTYNVYAKTITLKRAQELGMLPQLKIKHVEVKMDNRIRKHKVKYGQEKEVYLTDYDFYNYLCDQIDYWRDRYEESREFWMLNKIKQIGRQRQSHLADVKDDKVREIVAWLGDKRHIVFTGSIEQAERLGGDNAIHSKTKDKPQIVAKAGTKGKVNNWMVNAYNNKEINSLYAVGMLQEGYNLKDTQYGIAVQLGRKERKGIQISGRIVRAQDGVLFVLVVKGTVDEKFVEQSLQSVE